MKQCKWCVSSEHTSFYCTKKINKSIPKRGKRTIKYDNWRDKIARPYLDETYGHQCVRCGSTGNLDVDHVKSRGSNPHLKMDISNIQYLCRTCHILKTDRSTKY